MLKSDPVFGPRSVRVRGSPEHRKKAIKKKAADDDDLGDMDQVLDGLDPASVLDPADPAPAKPVAALADDSSNPAMENLGQTQTVFFNRGWYPGPQAAPSQIKLFSGLWLWLWHWLF